MPVFRNPGNNYFTCFFLLFIHYIYNIVPLYTLVKFFGVLFLKIDQQYPRYINTTLRTDKIRSNEVYNDSCSDYFTNWMLYLWTYPEIITPSCADGISTAYQSPVVPTVLIIVPKLSVAITWPF